MSDTMPEAEAPRVGLFWGATLASLAIGIAASIGGASVTPLLDVPALVDQVTGGDAAPADPGTPAEPGAAPAPEPTPAATDPCTVGTEPFTLLVCDTAERLGWTLSATAPEIAPGAPFTIAGDALAMGETLPVSRIQDGTTLVFTNTAGTVSTVEEPLPAQATASVADEIRSALGQSEIWFFDGENIVDAPGIYFGSGWTIATKYDLSRSAGDVVVAGSRTLTVTGSDPALGTFYSVS